MNIQYLNGGLANQVFQYIFVRYAELTYPDCGPWIFDDSFFFTTHVHNGYELDKVFNIKANLLSNCFEPDVWDEIIRLNKEGKGIPQILKDNGTDLIMYAETNNYLPFDGNILHMFEANSFHPQIPALDYPNIYYHGYWINKKWLNAHKDTIYKELAFPPLPTKASKEYANKILNTPSVAVHVRRGDYVTLGWNMPMDYYSQAIYKFYQKYQNFVLYVFSDDIEWCRQNATNLGFSYASDVVYVEGNTNGNNYIDLQLMSMCEGIVMSNSAFCYLAALLDKRLKVHITPTNREV